MTKEDLRIVYLGTPEFAVAGLRTLVEGGYHVVAVVTMPDKPAGRGHQLQYSDVKKYALEAGLPVLQPEKLKDEAFIEELRSYKADLQIVTAFRMLPEVVWAMPRLGTFNVHGSLLPQYRGAAPINWAVMNGEKETGLTTFMLKHEIDTGNMILQERIQIGADENVGSVHDRLMELSKEMVLRTVDLIIECENKGIPVPTTPQPESIELKPAPKIFKEDCEIKFNEKTAEEVHNFVRGLSPYPAAWANLTINGQSFENVKIFEVDIVESQKSKVESKEIIVPCKEGAVRILELQVPGKKRMDVRSFLNGIHN
ncbi:MAG: methionyl-tRNA formyltransferase [Paludibacteraceae bacterium]|nr:methionyl-tRNA formyltransferase [Paludibacteraceae bacterium]